MRRPIAKRETPKLVPVRPAPSPAPATPQSPPEPPTTQWLAVLERSTGTVNISALSARELFEALHGPLPAETTLEAMRHGARVDGMAALEKLTGYSGAALERAFLTLAFAEAWEREHTVQAQVALTDTEALLHVVAGELRSHPAEERMVVCYADAQKRLLHRETVGWGNAKATAFPLAHIYETAKRLGAKHVAAAHNHPSASPDPSAPDIEATKALAVFLRSAGMVLLDHIIVTQNDVVSMRHRGLF